MTMLKLVLLSVLGWAVLCAKHVDAQCEGADVVDENLVITVEFLDDYDVLRKQYVQPYPIDTTATEFYQYGTPSTASCNNAYNLGVKDATINFFVQNSATSEVSFVGIWDIPYDDSGGNIKMTLDAPDFAGCNIAVEQLDDPGEGGTNYYDDAVGYGQFTWSWAPCCTDGIAIGPFPAILDKCFTITYSGQVDVDEGSFFGGWDGISDVDAGNMDGFASESNSAANEYTVCFELLDDYVNTDECESDPCLNDATCEDDLGTYICHCKTGFEGYECQIDTNLCTNGDAGCENGGTCINYYDYFVCECPEGFYGNACEFIDACLVNPCLNGGSCSGDGDSYICTCPEEYGGEDCETVLGECGGSTDVTNDPYSDLQNSPLHKILFVNVYYYNYPGYSTTDGHNTYLELVSYIENTYDVADGSEWVVEYYLSADTAHTDHPDLNIFDQIWVYDLSANTDSYPNSWSHLASWYNDESRGENVHAIFDGRIISSMWSRNWQLFYNYYENLRLQGGGIMMGTDHNSFHTGINTMMTEMGFNTFSGNFYLTYIPVDHEHALITFPADASFPYAAPGESFTDENGDTRYLTHYLYDNSSPGQTPYWEQPNGRYLYTLAFHSSDFSTPGISSTFPSSLNFHVAVCSPVPFPAVTDCDTVTAVGSIISPGKRPYSKYEWWFYPQAEQFDDDTMTVISSETTFELDIAAAIANVNADPDDKYVLRFGVTDDNGIIAYSYTTLEVLMTSDMKPEVPVYPYGGCVGDSVFDKGDQDEVVIPCPNFWHWGTYYTSDWHINIDGGISTVTLPGYPGTCFPISGYGSLILPFWGDVDTRSDNSGSVYYRTSDTDGDLNDRATADVKQYYYQETSDFVSTFTFVATWGRVGYYEEHGDFLNTMQVVFTTDGERTFVIYNYPENAIGWNLANNKYAQVGFDKGDGVNYVKLGACGDYLGGIPGGTNCGFPGRYIYRTDQDIWASTQCTDCTEGPGGTGGTGCTGVCPALDIATLDSITYGDNLPTDCDVDTLTCTITLEDGDDTNVPFFPMPTSRDADVRDENNDIVVYGGSTTILVEHEGSTTFTITSADGSTTLTYTVNFIINKWVELESFGVEYDGGTVSPITPVYDPFRLDYTASIVSDFATATVTATACAACTIDDGQGNVQTGGSFSQAYTLEYLADTTVTLNVWETSGFYTYYTVVIGMTPSADADIDTITSTEGTVVYTTDSNGAINGASVTLSADSTEVDITVTTIHPHARINIDENGYGGVDGTETQTLTGFITGTVSYPIAILAEDDSSSRSIFLAVTRPASTNNDMASLTIDCHEDACDGQLTFNPSTNTYTVTVEHWIEWVKFTAAVDHHAASFTLNGAGQTNDVTSSSFTLPIPSMCDADTDYTFVVTAQDGSTQTYTVTVTKNSIHNLATFAGQTKLDDVVGVGTSTGLGLKYGQIRYAYINTEGGHDFVHMSATSPTKVNSPPNFDIKYHAAPGCGNVDVFTNVMSAAPAADVEFYTASLGYPGTGTFLVKYWDNTFNPSIESDPEYDVTFTFEGYVPTPLTLGATTAGITVNKGSWHFFEVATGGSTPYRFTYALTPTDFTPEGGNQVVVTTVDVVNVLGLTYTSAKVEMDALFPPFDPTANPDSNGDFSGDLLDSTTDTVMVISCYCDPNYDDGKTDYTFDVLSSTPLPALTLVTPLSSVTKGGTTMTLSGVDLDTTGSTPSGPIMIGSSECTNAVYTASRDITCDIPAGTGTGHEITIEIDGITSAVYGFTFDYKPPTITSITTAADPTRPTTGGFDITVAGTNFGPGSPMPTLTLVSQSGSQDLAYTGLAFTTTHSVFTANVDAGQGTYDIEVTVDGQTSANTEFTFSAPIVDIAGETSEGSLVIQIDGSNFGVNGDAQVDVWYGGEVPCDITAHSHTGITCDMTTGTLYNPIAVTVNEQTTYYYFLPECNDDCPPGYYNQSGPGQQGFSNVCEQCPSGTYNPLYAADGVDACADCPTGSFSTVGSSECIECEAGFYAASEGQSECDLCPPGHYCPAGASAAIECPAGTYTSAYGQFECLECEPGSVTASDGLTSCTLCPAGDHQPEAGQSECILCSAGRFSYSDGASSCEACAPGTISASDGSSRCDDCAAGKANANYGQSQCTTCTAGYFSAEGAVSCSKCDPGTFQASSNSDSCDVCAEGSYAGSSGATRCTLCDVGSYVGSTGQLQCIDCPAGEAASSTGSSECTLCEAGSASIGGEATCTTCGFGTYAANEGQATCEECSVGYHADVTGSSECKPCAVGKATDETGQTNCQTCAVGKHAVLEGSVTCAVCQLGRYAPEEGAGECTPCPKGQFQNETGSSFCYTCGIGEIASVEGSSVCTSCASGSTTQGATGQSTCNQCAAGSYNNAAEDPLVCTACLAGDYQASTGQQRCASCEPGTYSDVGSATTCTECTPGFFQDTSQQQGCEECPEGRYSDKYRTVECEACPAGYFSTGTGNTACTACGEGEYQPASGTTECVACPEGTFNTENGQTACSGCAAGSFQTGEGSTECEDCGAGSAQDDSHSTSCDPCEPGTEALTGGLTQCTDCVPGYYSNAETSLICTGCDVGTYQNAYGQDGCIDCQPGKYNNAKQALECSSCPKGFYNNGTAQTECMACGVGTYQSSTGQLECNLCPEGTFNDGTGRSVCSSCAAGKYNDQLGATACTACEPGLYSPAGSDGTSCTMCPLGSANALEGASECLQCDAGYYAPVEGLKNCLPCSMGSAVSFSGAVECDDCSFGEYADAEAQLDCLRCEPGTYTNNSNSIRCTDCSPGSYQPYESQRSCDLCPAGTFADDAAETFCEECPPGSYADEDGSASCIECPVGYAQDLSGQKFCYECPAGTYASAGSPACTTCGFGEVSIAPASEICLLCDRFAVPNSEQTKCLCDVGYAAVYKNDSLTAATCVECPKGAVCDAIGTEWDTMLTEEGWWVAESGEYYQCPYAYYCEGGAELGELQCADNRVGPLCAQCASGTTEDFDGNCVVCESEGASWAVLITVLVAAVLLLFLQFYSVLRAARPLLAASIVEDARKVKELEGYSDNEVIEFDADLRYEGVLTINGAPPVKPDFTYKLKIVIGFIQIITNLSIGLDIQWPAAFTAFVEAFNIFNLDLIALAGLDCVYESNYFASLYFWIVFPVVLIACIVTFYYLPIVIANRSNDNAALLDDEGARNRKRGRRNVWRLVLFALFLIYPTISSVVLRTFVCDEVEGVHYLRADFGVRCFESEWNDNFWIAIIATIVYPLGIPVFIYYKLNQYKHRLEEKGVRAQLGFLYDGYERKTWWFEMVDLSVKLILSSLIAFVPFEWQMFTAMIVTTVMILTICLLNPYLRKADNRLHFVALVEIFLMLQAGSVFNSLEEPDEVMEWIMSFVLIAVCVGFFAWWVTVTFKVIVKMLKTSDNYCIRNCLDRCGVKDVELDEEQYANLDEKLDAHASKAAKKRMTVGPMFAVSRAKLRGINKAGGATAADANMAVMRNPIYDSTEAKAQVRGKSDEIMDMHQMDAIQADDVDLDMPVDNADAVTEAVVDNVSLPIGWATGISPEGKTYYYNSELNITQWDKP